MNNFYAQLKIGQEKEKEIRNFLQLSGINCIQNNNQNIKDIDLYLPNINVLMDIKYLKTPFNASDIFVHIDSKDCITINNRHIDTYYKQQQISNKQVWVCFYINYKQFNIKELRFAPIKQLVKIKSLSKSVYNDRTHLDKNQLISIENFIRYCKLKNQINKIEFNY